MDAREEGSGDRFASLIADPAFETVIENVFIRSFPPGYRFGPHRHEFLELNYVRSGLSHLSFGGRVVPLRVGDCVLIFPGYSHHYTVSSRASASLLQLSFSFGGTASLTAQDFLEFPILARMRVPDCPFLKFTACREIPDCLTAIGRSVNSKNRHRELYIRIKLFELLVLLSEATETVFTSESQGDGPAAQAAKILRSRFNSPIDLEAVATECGVSPRGLRKSFARAYDMSPVAFLTALRVRKAETLLSETEFSVAEIAVSSGFASAAYLSRVFTREIGLGPSAYRSLVRRTRDSDYPDWTYEGTEKYKKSIPPGSFAGVERPFLQLD